MIYQVILSRKDEPVWIEDSILDFYKSEIELTECRFVENELKLCEICRKTCDQCYKTHVMVKIENNDHSWSKHCPVLFHDIVKPKWKVKEIL